MAWEATCANRRRRRVAWAGVSAVKSFQSAVALALCVGAACGCGKDLSTGTPAEGSSPRVPAVGEHGAGGLSTKNTTRLGGEDAATDAAAVAVAVYPGLTPATRPQAVVLVDEGSWPAALAASTLAGRPLHAPLLYSADGRLPEASERALSAMGPTGAPELGGTSAIAIGDAPAPAGYESRSLRGASPAALAVSIEQLASSLRKRSPDRVIVTSLDGPPAMSMPAAGLAAQSGAPVLFVHRTQIPPATAEELRRLSRPSIYVVGPTGAVDERVARALGRLGPVTRIDGPDPVSGAIAVARYGDGAFGWGVVEPGHGLVFASARRPLDAPAAAALSASGDYGPLLLVEDPTHLPPALSAYLSDLQPGTPPSGPVHGVYNHGWLIGGEAAISASVQAQIDAILEISPREAEPEAGVQPEA
jgi:hypothetical protein